MAPVPYERQQSGEKDDVGSRAYRQMVIGQIGDPMTDGVDDAEPAAARAQVARHLRAAGRASAGAPLTYGRVRAHQEDAGNRVVKGDGDRIHQVQGLGGDMVTGDAVDRERGEQRVGAEPGHQVANSEAQMSRIGRRVPREHGDRPGTVLCGNLPQAPADRVDRLRPGSRAKLSVATKQGRIQPVRIRLEGPRPAPLDAKIALGIGVLCVGDDGNNLAVHLDLRAAAEFADTTKRSGHGVLAIPVSGDQVRGYSRSSCSSIRIRAVDRGWVKLTRHSRYVSNPVE